MWWAAAETLRYTVPLGDFPHPLEFLRLIVIIIFNDTLTLWLGISILACISDQFIYEFHPEKYPSRPPYYTGRYKFQKHFFPQNQIEDLKAQSEEYEYAKAIDGISDIKHWIRNLVRRDDASFWLPMAHGKFYPDFIAELQDGRMLVIEYKGEAYVSNDDSVDKRAIGNTWADLSNGKCLFIMTVEQDDKGRDVRQQILDAI